MRYALQAGAMLADVILVIAMLAAFYELGFSGIVLSAIAFWAWRRVDGWQCWTPRGIRAFMRNARQIGL